jgi:GntR family transcriptional regulator
MFTKPSLNSGVPIYVQVKEQIIHAIEKGAVKPGEQLPSVRVFAEQLVVNPNTILKIYRELEVEGILEIRHGSGAFVSTHYKIGTKANLVNQGFNSIETLVDQLMNKGLTKEEIRRMVEAALLNRK